MLYWVFNIPSTKVPFTAHINTFTHLYFLCLSETVNRKNPFSLQNYLPGFFQLHILFKEYILVMMHSGHRQLA